MFEPASYMKEFAALLRHLDVERVRDQAEALHAAYVAGRTVFCFGNGGSAASASHFATDLTKLTAPTRGSRRLKAVALSDNVAAITAIGNDYSYEEIFSEQLRSYMHPGDVLVGFSTSGSSPNVLHAMEYGRRAGAVTIGITGKNGTALAERVDLPLMLPSTSVQQVEDATMVVAHLLCLSVKELCAAVEHRPAVPAGELPTLPAFM
jgi:D-sedoheptulose 7-phosphate isomerase